MTRKPVLGAIAVVLQGEHVLLARRRNPPDAGLWGFPGGHVEWGETALQAAVRELQEETGIIAEPQGYLTNVDVLRSGPDGQVDVHYLLTAVLCSYVEGQAQAADDVAEVRWATFGEVERAVLPMSARVADILALARRVSAPIS